MTTRAELRTAVRQRVEDTGGAPLWDDAALNEAIAGAIRRYSARFPREAAIDLAITSGGTSFPVVSETIDPTRIARVLDELGAVVPRYVETGRGPNATEAAAEEQAWRWWDGALRLTRPVATAATWRIEHWRARAVPVDDVTALDLIPGDEELIVALAVAQALARRVIEDGKRASSTKGTGPLAMLAMAARAEAERLITQRLRRVRGGWVNA